MNTLTKSLIVVLLLLGAAFGVYLLTSGGEDRPMFPSTGEQQPEPEPDRGPVEEVQVDRTERQDPGTSNVSRTEVQEHASSGEEFAQGVTGRVLDSRGAPAANVNAYLFEGVGNNLFQMMMKMQRGAIEPPLASTQTEPDGSFRLGLREVPPGKVFELRFTSEMHPDKVLPNLTLFADKWWDAGEVRLDPGVVVEGVVREEATGAPIEGASVTVQPAGQPFLAGATPGRENGVEVFTDVNGRFRLMNAPPGIANVSAAAEGFARVTMPNQQLNAEAPTTLEFSLPPGKSISGVVTDADGAPIRGASIQAFAISAKTPLTTRTRTDENGRFAVIGLVDGPYQVDVAAQGYIARQVKPVFAGAQDELIVLEQQGGARVRVVASNGRRIDTFELDVRRWFPEQDTHGFLHNRATERVRASDMVDGWYVVSGLDPGQYVFEVRSRGYAKAYSEPLEIAPGVQPPDREVTLSSGGRIQGAVVGVDGRPIAWAAVTTLPNNWEDNTISQMFGGLVPYAITQTGTRTDAAGKFDLSTLTPGTYQLKIEHPEAVTTYQKDVEVGDGRTAEVGTIRVEQGVVVFGTVRVDGQPTAQVRITVTEAIDPNTPPEKRTGGFSVQTVSDDQGNFRLPRRLPPGNYAATAARQGNPFLMVVDHNKTRQEFTVGSGMTDYQVHFQISSQ